MTNKNSESKFYENLVSEVKAIGTDTRASDMRRFKASLIDKIWAIETGVKIRKDLLNSQQKTIDEQAERIKTLEAENALLKESNERLDNSLREFKVFGTDECTECVNEKGRAQLGESYNRITLFYKPKEHSIHKQN